MRSTKFNGWLHFSQFSTKSRIIQTLTFGFWLKYFNSENFVGKINIWEFLNATQRKGKSNENFMLAKNLLFGYLNYKKLFQIQILIFCFQRSWFFLGNFLQIRFSVWFVSKSFFNFQFCMIICETVLLMGSRDCKTG